jgi:hypothetical protein
MAGACTLFDVNRNAKILWSSIFSSTVNGIVRNVHTNQDYVLLMFKSFALNDAIGRSKNFVGNKATEDQHVNATEMLKYPGDTKKSLTVQNAVIANMSVFELTNYDIQKLLIQKKNKKGAITEKTIGHSDFTKNLFRIFNFIRFDI